MTFSASRRASTSRRAVGPSTPLVDDFLLLHRTQALDEFVPVMITTATGEKDSAHRILEQMASDFIPTLSKHKQTVSTIRLNLLYHKLSTLLASRGKVLERYSHHLAGYPGDRRGVAFQKILTSIERSLSAHDRTIHQIETSLMRFTDLGKTVETQARE